VPNFNQQKDIFGCLKISQVNQGSFLAK